MMAPSSNEVRHLRGIGFGLGLVAHHVGDRENTNTCTGYHVGIGFYIVRSSFDISAEAHCFCWI